MKHLICLLMLLLLLQGCSKVDSVPVEITLYYTATGDDGLEGQAVSADLRYSESPLDESNWHLASVVPDVPAPGISGSTNTVIVGGLESNRTYYFAIKLIDDEGNTALISNIHVRTTPDLIPPDPVTDLRSTL